MKLTPRSHMRWLAALAVASAPLLPRVAVAQGPAPAALSPFAAQRPAAKPFAIAPLTTTAKDTLTCWACEPREKNIWYALGESSVGLWAAWSFNAFVRGEDFPWVNPKTWHDNIFGAWIWDDNSFVVNQIGHPYQGSLYYSGFRNNGYGFWTSSAAALGGSFLWECCFETHKGSPNDLISTWIGGVSFGEFGRRLSDLFIDNRAGGFERFGRETVAGVVNPIRLFDRLVRGEAWRKGANDPSVRPNWLQGVTDIGYLSLSTKQETRDSVYSGAVIRLGLIYGEPMSSITGKPFSHFQISADFTSLEEAHLYAVRSRGSLGGKFLRRDSTRTLMLASFLNYDYMKNPAYTLGAQSVTGGLMNNWRPNAKTNVYSDVLLRGVILGALETDYYNVTGEGRDYDFTVGGGLTAEVAVFRRGLGMVRGQYSYTGLNTVNGAASSHILQGGEVTARYELGGKYGIGGMYKTAWRRSFYGDGRSTVAEAPEYRIFVSTGLPRWTY